MQKAPTFLKHCYSCQKFRHVWANGKLSPLYVCCVGDQLQKEHPEEGYTASIPTSCNCSLEDGEEAQLPTMVGAGMPIKSCERDNWRGRQKLQQEKWSLTSTPPWDHTSLRCQAATKSNSSSICTGLPLHSRRSEFTLCLETQPTRTKSFSSGY